MKTVKTRIIAIALAIVVMLGMATTASAETYDQSAGYNKSTESASHDVGTVTKAREVPVEKAEEVVEIACDFEEGVIKHQTFDEIPLFNQGDYKFAYGNHGTVASHGCGLISIMMIASYMNDTVYDFEYYADYENFGHYNTDRGSMWIIFRETAEELGLPFVDSGTANGEWYDWDKVVEALENGQPVVCLQGSGYFTGGGHFIVLTGITEDGKILVNDPNGKNWDKNSMMVEGFADGFTPSQIKRSARAYWIYGEKEVEEPEIAVEDLSTKAATVIVAPTHPINPALPVS